MGVYATTCVVCEKPFMWFSGCVVQVCNDCANNPEVEVRVSQNDQTPKHLELHLPVRDPNGE
jgi:hypothetical protein